MYSVNVSAWPQVLFIIWLFPTIIPESTKCNSKCQTGHKLVYVQMISCLNMQATSLPLVMYDQFCPFNILVQTHQDATEWGTILDNWGANTLRLFSLVGVSPCVLQSQYVCSFMFSVRVCSLARLTPHCWSWEWRQHATRTISRICWLSERTLFDVILGYFNQFSKLISALYQIRNSLKQVTHIYLVLILWYLNLYFYFCHTSLWKKPVCLKKNTKQNQGKQTNQQIIKQQQQQMVAEMVIIAEDKLLWWIILLNIFLNENR